jgi:HSP20 family protein
MTQTLVRSPFADVDRAFRNLWAGSWAESAPARDFAPAVDAYHDGEDLVASFDLPGVNPEDDVIVEVEGRKLVVRGERKDTRDEEQNGRRFREVRFGSFRRTVALPRTVDADAVSASYDAGVLTVRVAGAYAGTTPSRIEITNAA